MVADFVGSEQPLRLLQHRPRPRLGLDLVEMALEREGGIASTVMVDDGTLTPSLMRGDFDGSAALWKATEREHTLLYSEPYSQTRLILDGQQGHGSSRTGSRRASIGSLAVTTA